ncbi:hypothetical protein ACIQ34_04345 [Ureibacillus sp. NPDC094379]
MGDLLFLRVIEKPLHRRDEEVFASEIGRKPFYTEETVPICTCSCFKNIKIEIY